MIRMSAIWTTSPWANRADTEFFQQSYCSLARRRHTDTAVRRVLVDHLLRAALAARAIAMAAADR